MSAYHTSFNYLGANSRIKKLIVSSFDVDSGEVETNLSLEPIYTDSAFGVRRYDYGSKYNSVATFRITVIKESGTDFSVTEVRDCLKWLTGTTTSTNLELLVGNQVKCVFNGRITNVWQQKMAARTVGLVLEFTSTSPFGYSSKQIATLEISGTKNFQINCPSDDLFSYVYLQTTYTNSSGDSLAIENATTDDITTVTGLSLEETIVINGPMMITSNKYEKTFGNTFNFVFPRLAPGINDLSVTANGNISFEYVYPIKIGNVAVDIEELSNAIDCSSNPDIGSGTAAVDFTPWENVWNKPSTIEGYCITDAYTSQEVDDLIQEINTELGSMYDTLIKMFGASISWSRIAETPTTLSGYKIEDAYTSKQVDDLLAKKQDNLVVSNSVADNDMNPITSNAVSVYVNNKLASVYKYKGSVLTGPTLNSIENPQIGDVYNVVNENGMNYAWNGEHWDALGSTVDLTPYLTTADAANTYATTKSVDDKLDNIMASGIKVDESELNSMLAEILI